MTIAKLLTYKGYVGTVEYSNEDDCFFGKVLGMGCNLISYEGMTIEDLERDFTEAIEYYLSSCQYCGREPFKPTVSPLLAQGVTKIENEMQYESLLARVEELAELLPEDTPANDPRMVELTLLGNLVADYDEEHYPVGSKEISE